MTTWTSENNPPSLPEDRPSPALASIPGRAVAYAVDKLLVALLVSVISLAAFHLAGLQNQPREAYPLFLFSVLVFSTLAELVYFSWFIAISGRTPGKYLMGLKVVSRFNGEEPGTARAIFRAFGYILSSAVFMLGFIWVLFDPERQAWHDKLAGTMVVNSRSS